MDPLQPQPQPTRCPKCAGAMTASSDAYGPYLRCFTCGHHVDLITVNGRLVPRPPPSTAWTPDAVLPTDNAYTCDEAPKCTDCPLPFCKFEVKAYDQTKAFNRKQQEILAIILNEGLSTPEAADRFGISERTVYRIKARGRASPPPPKEP